MNGSSTVDPALIGYYRDAMIGGQQFHGLNILQYEHQIAVLIQETGAKTLLDYGSGRGHQYTLNGLHRRWGILMPAMYDPAVEEFSEKPRGVFDGVICSDVVEHVSEPYVEALIAELFAYSKLFVWASVCCRPAKKSFPDGRNMHVTIRPPDWWKAKFTAAAGNKRFAMVITP